jgi:hypothetical protein
MGLRGNVGTIRGLKQRINQLPISIAHDVAARAAPSLTDAARSAFDGGQTVYGESRPAGRDGKALTLERTGATRGGLRFEATGTIVRCVLPTRWAKYLIGKYKILPQGALPAEWQHKLAELLATTAVKP